MRDFLKLGMMSVVVMNKMSDELRLIVLSVLMRRLIASRIISSEAEKHLKIDENLSDKRKAAPAADRAFVMDMHPRISVRGGF